ncbi:PREDICTED: serine--tRNA ligase [Prunus dulcis]|uniref:PREDICTED: serine--tRNA ligase n=1 Tax=Prunus dulcis TaxID=3755 RepID=A0A5E4EMG5_PRUDU|nr:PREDICTED: serine--tRNA ligase [Prunus dulcis]
MLDINLFREDKGNNPKIISDSQQRRFKGVEIVDEGHSARQRMASAVQQDQQASFSAQDDKIVEDDKYRIATAEQALCACYMNDWIHPSQLPLRYAGYSSCFRKEAGSHGRDTSGIFRVLEFEMNSFLTLPYRVVAIVSGALPQQQTSMIWKHGSLHLRLTESWSLVQTEMSKDKRSSDPITMDGPEKEAPNIGLGLSLLDWPLDESPFTSCPDPTTHLA